MYSYGTCGHQRVKISTRVEYTIATASKGVGTAGALSIAPATLSRARTRVSFRPFVCFTNLLNMKFVIGAYKRVLKYVVFNCIIVSSLNWYLRVVLLLGC